MKELAYLFNKLKDPEYLYMLIENFMIWGLAIGLVSFAVAFFCKERKSQIGSLILIILACVMVVPYIRLREKSDKGKGYFFPSTKRTEMVAQQDRWEKAQWVFFAVAGLAGATLLMGAHTGKPGLFTGILTGVAGICCVFFTIWLNLKEAEIHHPNLRDGPRVTSTFEKRTHEVIDDARRAVKRTLKVRPE